MTARFAYHAAVGPMMWAVLAVCGIELVVDHFLLALWWPRVALVVSALSLASVVWLIGVLRSFRRLPVLIEDDRLVMRVGTLRRIDVPRARVRGLRESWDAAALKAPGVAKLSLLAYPNILVEVDPPLSGRRRDIKAVAHRLDDPAGFSKALTAWLVAPSPSA